MDWKQSELRFTWNDIASRTVLKSSLSKEITTTTQCTKETAGDSDMQEDRSVTTDSWSSWRLEVKKKKVLYINLIDNSATSLTQPSQSVFLRVTKEAIYFKANLLGDVRHTLGSKGETDYKDALKGAIPRLDCRLNLLDLRIIWNMLEVIFQGTRSLGVHVLLNQVATGE